MDGEPEWSVAQRVVAILDGGEEARGVDLGCDRRPMPRSDGRVPFGQVLRSSW